MLLSMWSLRLLREAGWRCGQSRFANFRMFELCSPMAVSPSAYKYWVFGACQRNSVGLNRGKDCVY